MRTVLAFLFIVLALCVFVLVNETSDLLGGPARQNREAAKPRPSDFDWIDLEVIPLWLVTGIVCSIFVLAVHVIGSVRAAYRAANLMLLAAALWCLAAWLLLPAGHTGWAIAFAAAGIAAGSYSVLQLSRILTPEDFKPDNSARAKFVRRALAAAGVVLPFAAGQLNFSEATAASGEIALGSFVINLAILTGASMCCLSLQRWLLEEKTSGRMV